MSPALQVHNSSSQRVRRSTIPVVCRPASTTTTTSNAISPSIPSGRRISYPDPPPSRFRSRASPSRQETVGTSKRGSYIPSPSTNLGYFSIASHPAQHGEDSTIREARTLRHYPKPRDTTRPIFASGDGNGFTMTENEAIVIDMPDPRLVLEAVNDLGPHNSKIYKVLEVDLLMTAYEQCLIDRGEGLKDKRQKDEPRTAVFGVSLWESSKYAFTSSLFNGHEVRLPVVVFNCVEELYRTGIYQPDLFRVLPNRKRLSELVRIFNSPDPRLAYKNSHRQRSNKVTEYNATLLHHESTPDVCALLTDFLCSLPEPILPSYLFDAVWEAAELDKQVSAGLEFGGDVESLIRENQRRKDMPLLVKTYSDVGEATRIKVVQHLLCLLPLPNFAVLVYLLAFFSHVAMMQEVNGASTQELGRLFGKCVFGGRRWTRPSQPASGLQGRNIGTRKNGDTMMCWFLKKWALLSNGLFELRETFLTDRPSTIPTETKGSHWEQELDHSPRPSASISPPSQYFNNPFELAGITSGAKTDQGPNLSRQKNAAGDDREGFEHSPSVTRATTMEKALASVPMSTATSVYSSAANERLLDVAFPDLFDDLHLLDNLQADYPVSAHSVDDHDLNRPSAIGNVDDPRAGASNHNPSQAQPSVHNLERQLQKSDAIVAQALEVMFRAKRRIDEIDDHLEELEIILRCGMPFRQNASKAERLEPSGGEAKLLKERLEIAMMERRKAYQLVTRLRDLMSGEL